MTQIIKQKLVGQRKKWDIIHFPDKAEGRSNHKQAAVAGKAWQSKLKEDTRHLIMSMDSRLQAVNYCKGNSYVSMFHHL